MPVGSSAAGRILHLAPPPLRLRFRHGVYVDLRGYPDWQPYAAALVELPPAPHGWTGDEARILRVVTANRLLATLARDTDAIPDGAPPGWVWAHLGRSETLALVPAELHGAFRHRGGTSDHGVPPGSGIRDAGAAVALRRSRTVTDDAVAKFEDWLGYRLPDGYRDLLAESNGGIPARAAVLPTGGVLVDQPLFGLAAADRMFDLAYANLWLRDRLTADFLAIGYAQGGLLILKVRGAGAGSVWHWDDDDARDDDRYGPDVICRDLLRPLAGDIHQFRSTLSEVPSTMTGYADESIRSGAARPVPSEAIGAALPRTHRRPWVTALTSGAPADLPGSPR
jgi:hypothetical protein